MTKLVVRKIPWEFDASVPFMWQPARWFRSSTGGGSAQEVLSNLPYDEFKYRTPGGRRRRVRRNTWMREYARGTDMTSFSGVRPGGPAPAES